MRFVIKVVGKHALLNAAMAAVFTVAWDVIKLIEHEKEKA